MRNPKDIKIGEFTLEEILERHRHWWFEDCDGWKDMRADLSGADLSGADLSEADLSRAKNAPFIPMACPDTGAFIGFKKASDRIVMLGIPEDARRLSATGRKCRCDKANVIRIEEMDGTVSDRTVVASDRDSSFVYKVGKMVSVPNFCEDRWQECSAGIHFFINRQEAVNYCG